MPTRQWIVVDRVKCSDNHREKIIYFRVITIRDGERSEVSGSSREGDSVLISETKTT